MATLEQLAKQKEAAAINEAAEVEAAPAAHEVQELTPEPAEDPEAAPAKKIETFDDLAAELGDMPSPKEWQEAAEKLNKAIKDNPAFESIKTAGDALTKAAEQNGVSKLMQTLREITESPAMRALRAMAEKHQATMKALAEIKAGTFDWPELIRELSPYLCQVRKNEPEYQDILFIDLCEALESEEPLPEKWAEFIEKAEALRDETEAEQAEVYTLTATAKDLEQIMFGVDKVNSGLWNFGEIESGQLQYKFNMASEKDQAAGRALPLLLALDFEAAIEQGLTLKREINHYDERLYSVADSFQQAGYTAIDFSQLHYAMGHSTMPNSRQLERIHKSLAKMNFTQIYIDNKAEAEAYNYDRYFVDYERLLPGRIILEKSINKKNPEKEKITRGVLIIQGPLPAAEFSRQHGNQVTTIHPKLLQTGLSDTENNLSLEHYLIRRIARAKRDFEKAAKNYASLVKKFNKGKIAKEPKRPKAELPILLETLYKDNKIDTKKRRHDAKPKIEEILKHYINCGYIAKYKLAADKITITW